MQLVNRGNGSGLLEAYKYFREQRETYTDSSFLAMFQGAVLPLYLTTASAIFSSGGSRL